MIFKPGDRVVTPMGRIGIVKREMKAHGDIEFQYEDDPSIEGRATLKPQYLKHYREPGQVAKSLDRDDPRRPEAGGGVFGKNPVKVMEGRKGGKAAAANMTPEQRHLRAQIAIITRWHGVKSDKH